MRLMMAKQTHSMPFTLCEAEYDLLFEFTKYISKMVSKIMKTKNQYNVDFPLIVLQYCA